MLPVTLRIERQWDGRPAAGWDAATVILAASSGTLHLRIDAPHHGDPPPDAPPGRLWKLWEHEVVEVFVAGAGESYVEIEVGPHGHYLALGLSAVRQVAMPDLPVEMSWRSLGSRWQAEVSLDTRWLPPRPWRANAFAINGLGRHRQWLAAHPLSGERPDFHQPGAFAALVAEDESL